MGIMAVFDNYLRIKEDLSMAKKVLKENSNVNPSGYWHMACHKILYFPSQLANVGVSLPMNTPIFARVSRPIFFHNSTALLNELHDVNLSFL